MTPPTQPLNLDVEAISGICGSISIACWVVVFSPQILENFRRGSADGLSLHFIIVWLLGDVFNILGAVLQGVLPTMIILAIYYTIADLVLLGQCFYYRGFTLRDEVIPPTPTTKTSPPQLRTGEPDERTGLLASPLVARERRGSDWSSLSPVVPLVTEPPTKAALARRTPSMMQTVALNTVAVLMVCAAGVAGWFLSRANGSSGDGSGSGKDGDSGNDGNDVLVFNFWGQVFGYLCAALYLGSRLPQLLLNWRRQSTDGVSMLFFLFACLGNLTYVLSIFAYDPKCSGNGSDSSSRDGACAPGEAARIYGQYILVNASWLAGSAGTLLLDLGIFVQFFMYNKGNEYRDEEGDHDEEESIDGERWDQRPLLQRGDSTFG
jgi:uncharacterized protein with PQ loop repeat